MDTFRINGATYDYGSASLRINGERYEGVKSIKYDQKRTRTKVTGLNRSRRPKGRTRGNYEAGNVTLTMLRKTAQDLRDALALLSTDGQSYGDAEVPIVVTYFEPTLGLTKDELLSCSIESDAGGAEDNPDPLYEDVVFSCLHMKRNGKTLYGANT